MTPPFIKHIFVCLNERDPGNPRGDCTQKGSPDLLKKLKAALKARGLDETIRANKAGCLDNCEQGCSVVVYPEGVWYGHVTEADVEEIVEQHLRNGKPVERLQLFKK
jgi:(2Fe-2S) ferredoxin